MQKLSSMHGKYSFLSHLDAEHILASERAGQTQVGLSVVSFWHSVRGDFACGQFTDLFVGQLHSYF